MSDVAQTTPAPADAPRGILWLLRALALAALLLSGYLGYVSLTAERPLGCGKGSGGCEEMLKGRWGYVAGLPVSVPAVSLFATLLAGLCFAGSNAPPQVRQLAWSLTAALAIAGGAAALWFLALQAFVLFEFCWYCLALHALSLSIAVAVLISGTMTRQELLACSLVALLATMLFVAAQVALLPPSSYQVATAPRDDNAGRLNVALSGESGGEPRMVLILRGQVEIDTTRVPAIGSIESEQIVVVMFDYSCSQCRTLRRQLASIAKKDRLTVLALPVPQHPSCNEFVDLREASGEDACELARLALAVWHINPVAFVEFDAWLLADPRPPSAAAARHQAEQLVGEQPLTQMLASGQVDADLQQLIDMSQQLPSPIMPQLHRGERYLIGSPTSTAELERILDREFGIVMSTEY